MYCTFIKRWDNWRGILYLHTEENLNFSADRQYGILRVMLYKPLMYIYLIYTKLSYVITGKLELVSMWHSFDT